MALLTDLHDLYLVVSEVQICNTILKQAAIALRDEGLMATREEIERQTKK